MTGPDRATNTKRLWMIAIGAGLIALASGAAFAFQIRMEMGWVGLLVIAALTGIIYGICFYVGVVTFENTLERYIVSDTFSKKHDWIDLETQSRSSGSKGVDAWVTHYKFARTALAMGILPLLACIYLFWFA